MRRETRVLWYASKDSFGYGEIDADVEPNLLFDLSEPDADTSSQLDFESMSFEELMDLEPMSLSDEQLEQYALSIAK